MTVQADAISLLTIAEAAQVARVPQSRIRVWIWRYELATTRLRTGRVLVSERDILRCELATRTRTGHPKRSTPA